jgi:hypothetical protein
MIKVQTSAGIRTSAELRSFRSLRHPVGPSLRHLDRGRLANARAHRAARMDHRVWFLGMSG